MLSHINNFYNSIKSQIKFENSITNVSISLFKDFIIDIIWLYNYFSIKINFKVIAKEFKKYLSIITTKNVNRFELYSNSAKGNNEFTNKAIYGENSLHIIRYLLAIGIIELSDGIYDNLSGNSVLRIKENYFKLVGDRLFKKEYITKPGIRKKIMVYINSYKKRRVSKKNKYEHFNLEKNFENYNYHDFNRFNKYKILTIPKSNGKNRIIRIPNSQTKNYQRYIVNFLKNNNIYQISPNATAYIKNKGIKTNVEKHKESNYFIFIDMTNFFENISESKINNLLKGNKIYFQMKTF